MAGTRFRTYFEIAVGTHPVGRIVFEVSLHVIMCVCEYGEGKGLNAEYVAGRHIRRFEAMFVRALPRTGDRSTLATRG